MTTTAHITSRQARGLPRKWTARIEFDREYATRTEIQAESLTWDTLAEVTKAAIREAAEYLRAGLARDARVYLDKQLARDPEPKYDRQVAYLWLERPADVRVQRF